MPSRFGLRGAIYKDMDKPFEEAVDMQKGGPQKFLFVKIAPQKKSRSK